jgi:hypothetical protein
MRYSKLKNPDKFGANHNSGNSRRSFLKKATAATVTLAGTNFLTLAVSSCVRNNKIDNKSPWYRQVKRWGQINITLDNAGNFDIGWWRKYWKRTLTQGIVLNAGGIYAYYPTKIPLHFKATQLGDHDLFGDLCKAAHEDGLVVFARMDSGRANEDFYKAHPDWFAINADGKPYIREGLYTTCINGPYYQEFIPKILTEIIKLYHPEGITDNSWEGLGRESPCYCENCRKSFRDRTGKELPVVKNWDDPVYREWILWNFNRRLEQWDLNNRTTKSAGGPNCTWSGMISSYISGESSGFCDLKELCDRADIIMIDAQARTDAGGFSNTFQQNADTGKRIHGLVGWDKIAAESMAVYQAGLPRFRVSSKPEPEAHMWMLEGIAGGIAPWWHKVSGYHEDRRMYHTVEPVARWHKANEEYLFNRTPIATVGVVWSQDNTTWYGRDEAALLVDLPTRGITQSLVRARIPYTVVDADHIDRDADQLSLLILPNIGGMTDDQIASVRRFVEGGGGLIATGESSLYDKFGDRRPDYALGDLFGAHLVEKSKTNPETTLRKWAGGNYHTYLRLTPELRGSVDGPMNGKEPVANGERHAVLKGFEETDIIPFAGLLESVRTDPDAQVLMTFIPVFPTMPPEDAFMRESKTEIQGLILNTTKGGSRIAFLPADIDRQYARTNLPDHGDLLANLVHWASKDNIPLEIEGAGLIDCNIYHQPGRMIMHMANLINAGTWRQALDEYIPIGPVSVRLRLTDDVQGKNLNLLVSGKKIAAEVKDGWSHFRIDSILNHEVVVLT